MRAGMDGWPAAPVRPGVGLLYNPAIPATLPVLGDLIEHLSVIPDRLWYDFDAGAPQRDGHPRFAHATDAVDELRRCLEGRRAIGHGIGLSLPSAMPLDEALLDEVAACHKSLRFDFYSEHLAMFLVPPGADGRGGRVPNAQAGLGLPVPLDHETLAIVGAKARRLAERLGVPIALENGTIFSAIDDADFTEPAFFNALWRDHGCAMLLDLHNLHANQLNLGWDVDAYLAALDPAIVVELHLAGGDWLHGHYTDSHSRPTPAPVWDWAHRWAPRFPNLRAITYEYHESYQARLGLDSVPAELEGMHALADAVAAARRMLAA